MASLLDGLLYSCVAYERLETEEWHHDNDRLVTVSSELMSVFPTTQGVRVLETEQRDGCASHVSLDVRPSFFGGGASQATLRKIHFLPGHQCSVLWWASQLQKMLHGSRVVSFERRTVSEMYKILRHVVYHWGFGDSLYLKKGGSSGAYQCCMHSLGRVANYHFQTPAWGCDLTKGPSGDAACWVWVSQLRLKRCHRYPQMTHAAPHSKKFNKFEAGWMNYNRSLEEQAVHWGRRCSLFCLECGLDMIASCQKAAMLFVTLEPLKLTPQKFYCVQSRRTLLEIGWTWYMFYMLIW